jgi:hypothetical protein
MATDRYSDDYTIVVSGGNGTLTADADLDITGGLSFTGDLIAPGDLSVTGSITTTDLNFSGSGTSNISSASGDIAITSSTGDVTVTCQDTLGLYAGVGGTVGIVKISPSGPATPSYDSVYITLSESDDKIVVGGPTLSIITDSIELKEEITYPISRQVHLAVPYIAFSRDDILNSVNSVKNSYSGSLDIDGGGFGGVAYLVTALPDSIPDGSQITSIDGGFAWSALAPSTASVSLNLLECLIGSSGAYSTVQTDTKTIENDSVYYFKSFNINYTISKSKANMISVVVTLPSTQSLYFYGIRITYQTGRVDLNVEI